MTWITGCFYVKKMEEFRREENETCGEGVSLKMQRLNVEKGKADIMGLFHLGVGRERKVLRGTGIGIKFNVFNWKESKRRGQTARDSSTLHL